MAVYWVGNDGNIWLKNDSGVSNVGTATNYDLVDSGFRARAPFAAAEGYGTVATRIDNPSGPAIEETGTNVYATDTGGGGGTASQFTDTSKAREATLGSINSLDDILANKLAEARGEYDALLGTYKSEEAENQAAYNKNVQTNEGTREAQRQAALLAAANGGRGLNSVLASIGALGGTGKLLANRAVANEANMDLGNANKTFDTNATNLFDSFGKLRKQEEQRKKDAELTLKKTEQQHRYDADTQRQSLWKEMADLWTKAGNNSEADTAMGRAASLTKSIAGNTRPNVPEYARTPLQFSAPALQSYLAGANDMTVQTSAGGGLPINGAIYTSTKKRDKMI